LQATHLRCGGIFNDHAEPEGERILNIGQHLLKLWEGIVSCFFDSHGSDGTAEISELSIKTENNSFKEREITCRMEPITATSII